MKNFAKILMAVGIATAGLSAILMGYLPGEDAAYQMCWINIVLGFIMFAIAVRTCGSGVADRNKKDKRKG